MGPLHGTPAWDPGWQAKVSISFATISLTKATVGVLVFCHWMA